MAYIPDLPVLVAFTLAAWLLAITPGPDMTLFLSRTLGQGRAAGIASLTGAAAGTLVHTALAVLGISAIVAASQTAFLVLKIIGALYLAWLAIDAIRSGSTFRLDEKRIARRVSLKRAFMAGLGVNLLNPKIVLFYMTFLPQFVAAGDPYLSQKMIFLGLLFVVVTYPVMLAMILTAERFAHALKSHPRIARGIDYLFASVFGIFAVRILLEEGR